MSRRLLQVLGVLTLLAVAGASVAALLTVREHLHVTIAGETASRTTGPDPVALLRDDVSGLRSDLAALTQTLGRNFETLASGDDDRETARAKSLEAAAAAARDASGRVQAALDRLTERVDALERGADARAGASHAEVLAAIEGLRQRIDRFASEPVAGAPAAAPSAAPAAPGTAERAPAVAALPAAAPPAPPAAPPATLAAAGAGTAPAATATAAPAAAPPEPPPTPAAPAPRKKSFLSFALPSESLDYGQRLRFEVLPSLSRVGFDAKSTLHDFSGVTSEVSGSFTANLLDGSSPVTGEVRARAAALDTGLADRNAEMGRTLDTERFPDLVFVLDAWKATSVDPRTKASSGTAQGRLTIHGVTKPVTFPLRVSLDESRRALVEGEATMRMTDFGVAPPRKMGLISVEDTIRVWVALRARATGRAE